MIYRHERVEPFVEVESKPLSLTSGRKSECDKKAEPSSSKPLLRFLRYDLRWTRFDREIAASVRMLDNARHGKSGEITADITLNWITRDREFEAFEKIARD